MKQPPPPLIGWPLLPLPDANGQLNFPSLETSIRQQIQVILRTRPGEQLMRPAFGAGLSNFLHESNDLTTRRRIHDSILESLERWEPRVFVDRVDVNDVPDQPTYLRIEITYRVRRTGVSQVVGLTMEMEV